MSGEGLGNHEWFEKLGQSPDSTHESIEQLQPEGITEFIKGALHKGYEAAHVPNVTEMAKAHCVKMSGMIATMNEALKDLTEESYELEN